MHCKPIFRRMRSRRAASETQRVPPAPAAGAPIPAALARQLATPITSMHDVETLLAYLYCAKARGYF